MPSKPINITIAVTGASGAIYAKVLFDTIVQHKNLFKNIAVVMSDNAKYVWQYELNNTDYKNYPFTFFDKNEKSITFKISNYYSYKNCFIF